MSGLRVHTPVLVVGGTGILRPAVRTLCASGFAVGAVGRDQERLDTLCEECTRHSGSGRCIGIVADYSRPAQFGAALEQASAQHGPFGAAILYCPGASEAALEAVGRVVTGRVVLLLVSAFVAPERAEGREGYPEIPGFPRERTQYLLLGWHQDGTGARWHTPQEIAAASLEVLYTGRDDILGAIRPWSNRPA